MPEPPDAPRIVPEPRTWGERLRARGTPLDDRARRFRRQLGLPQDRPVILSGHQAAFWHPGILAKYLAMSAASRALDAAPAWITVDQDDNDPLTIRYPAVDPDAALVPDPSRTIARPRVGVWRAGDAGGRGVPTASRPASPVVAPAFTDARPADDAVARGLERIAEALRRHSHEPTLARQVARALDDLLAPLVPPAQTLFASALAATDAFAEILDAIRRDPRACTLAYNHAVAMHPGAGVRPLIIEPPGGRCELPLWALEAARPRRPVFAHDLPALAPDRLAPRALLLTGLLRSGACDLFIHGTGGGGPGDDAPLPPHAHANAAPPSPAPGYDRVTRDWFARWLGPSAALCPLAVVTATLRLPMPGHDPTTPEHAARAAWTAHRARHDPAILGDAPRAAEAAAIVEAIRRARGDRARRAALYASLHRLLADSIAAHADEIARLDRLAADARADLAASRVRSDRTWPFPVYPPSMLAALRDSIERAFLGSDPHRPIGFGP